MKHASFFCACIAGCAALLFSSCSSTEPLTAPYREYGSFARPIPIPAPGQAQLARFSAGVPGVRDSVIKSDSSVVRGFTTRNREFLSDVITPILAPIADSLRSQAPSDIINALAIFGHELFRMHLGKEFYRWGGDINDLDDPQEKGSRYAFAYGLDCSGFVNLPYELALRFALIDSASEGALFTAQGFARYCQSNHVQDKGSRTPNGNRFRLDTEDLYRLGREVFTVERGASPSDEELRRAQPGDIVIRRGHVGMLVEIDHDLYYLESGGRVVPKVGWHPCHAKEAIEIFAKGGALSIRRALPDRQLVSFTAESR
ncbi:MAG: hypothetical protein ACM3Q4_13250 [Acidobacteriota bacterium]